jgi:hypothetical protein
VTVTWARALERLLSLTGAERRLLLRAFLWISWIDLRLRLFRGALVADLHRDGATPASHPVTVEDVSRAQRYAHWIEVASRYYPVPARCLHRSLTLHRWLSREGLPSAIRIGVRKDGATLNAHAWVELGGHIVNDVPAAVAPFALLTEASCPQPPLAGRPLT